MPVEDKNYKFNYILYTLIVALSSFLLWAFAQSYAMPAIMISCALALIIKNDLKYGLPFIVNFMFVNGELAASTTIDIGIYIGCVVLIVTLIVYLIRNKVRLKFGRFGLNFAILAVLALLPLIWSKVSSPAFYALYFGWLGYFVVYIFFVSAIRKDIKEEFSLVMEALVVLLSLECLISVFRIREAGGSLSDIYTLGWGICNEAGIVLCMIIPFAFYQFFTTLKTKENLYHISILLIGALGVLMTLSRGTIMFAILEYGLMILYMLLNKKKYKTTIALVSIGLIILGLAIAWKFDFFLSHAMDFIDDNGRFALYNKAIDVIKKGPLYALFGAGFAFDIDFKDAVFVCHSTIYETLAVMGIVGLLVLLIHFALKYNMLIKHINIFNSFMLIGFIVVDIYGLIDNTYHMYYYMFTLVMILTVIEKSNKLEVRQ